MPGQPNPLPSAEQAPPIWRHDMTSSMVRTMSTCIAALFVTTMLVTAATSPALFF
jgi:hypothetical protein